MVKLVCAIGLVGAGILVLALRPVALFAGEERWVQVDVNDGSSYSVNAGLRGIAGHWAYPAVVTVTVPPGVSDAVVRGRMAGARDVLPAVLREGELLFYTSNAEVAAERARAAGYRATVSQDPGWKVYARYTGAGW